MSLRPTKLEMTPDATLAITWSDDEVRHYTAANLRDGCPCATCREKRKQPPPMLNVLQPGEAEPLSIADVRPVGSYAYSIVFSDGHDTGIFTLERLRELGEVAT